MSAAARSNGLPSPGRWRENRWFICSTTAFRHWTLRLTLHCAAPCGKKLDKNAAVLIVAQRVSTIMGAEQIIVLDHGRIVGRGTHEQLLKDCPEYLEIAQSQLSKEELQ